MTIQCPKCKAQNSDTQSFCGNCGTQLILAKETPVPTQTIEAPKEELTTGSTFAGRYQIIEELGRGGMGKVYKAQDTEVKDKIALKLIRPEISSDKKTIERFQNELKLARKISHRNVCRMYDLGKSEGNYFITMEYVDGENLKGMIRMMGQLSSGKAVSVAKQVCKGLTEAHSKGVVHRDLKPSNIMIDKEGNAKIMDFGIARSLAGKGITGAGVMIGTPDYMSPEQVESKEVDQRSDVYSLGVILYEMLTGQVPFEGDTPFSIGVKHKSETPRNPKEINPQISDDLNQLIIWCLEKEKEKRYPSAGELYSELENIERDIPTTDKVIPKRKPITSKEITVSLSTKKLLIPVIAIIAIVIIGLFLWHPWSRVEAPVEQTSKPSVAILPFEDISPQKDQEYLCNGIVDSIISALSNIKEMRVPARGSSSLYKKEGKDYKVISGLLNVDYILDGTLQKSGDTLRIRPKLINIADDSILWSTTYDTENQDVFSIQDEITQAIVDELKVNLLADEKEKVYKRGTKNAEAFNLYSLGKFHLEKRSDEDLYNAYDYFYKAIELDPNYALAYVGLADTYIVHPFWGSPPPDARHKAEEAAEKAFAIDENLTEAHTSLAWIKMEYYWDWEGAEREFKRALELNPNYATAHQWYAEFLTNMGKLEDARLEIERALELSPLSQVVNLAVGFVDFHGRRYDKAISQYKKTMEMFPNFLGIYDYLFDAYLYSGRHKELLEEVEEWFEKGIWSERGLATARMWCELRMGRKEAPAQYFEKIKSNVGNYTKAEVYFELGDIDQGFFFLEKAYEQRNVNMRFIKVSPAFDNIRNDPKYKEILRKMNLD